MKLSDEAYKKTASYLWNMSKYYKRDSYGFCPIYPVQPVLYANRTCHFFSIYCKCNNSIYNRK